MLNNIDSIISPILLKTLAEMGHGDEIVFGDSNFPAASHAQRLIRADGHRITSLLKAILPLVPLDYAVDFSAILMNYRGDAEPNVWKLYREIIGRFPDGDKTFVTIPKPEFYDRAKKAYCIVATSESEAFANIIIRKGCIRV